MKKATKKVIKTSIMSQTYMSQTYNSICSLKAILWLMLWLMLWFIGLIGILGLNNSYASKHPPPKNPSKTQHTKKQNTIIKNKTSLCLEKSTRKILTTYKNTIPVFKRDGSKQCEPPVANSYSLKKMKNTLKKMKIKVFKTTKGQLRNTRVPSTCGAPTGNINVFYISPKSIKQVAKKGFKTCLRDVIKS